ncbi:hypothetical protein DOTSEDRAFT_38538 [Dothistroma septosporum NZE10]|uniref:Uncharacterized protein n=1 Tax=Dothistroma septosporum (strain NZE10 / CBS 128990) TaxID=675120 RepID=M2XIQ8_DOTSN|nr:hypothetical protein DOTSEDRAFT_38538 [Dothistroma septosporum NZE10]
MDHKTWLNASGLIMQTALIPRPNPGNSLLSQLLRMLRQQHSAFPAQPETASRPFRSSPARRHTLAELKTGDFDLGCSVPVSDGGAGGRCMEATSGRHCDHHKYCEDAEGEHYAVQIIGMHGVRYANVAKRFFNARTLDRNKPGEYAACDQLARHTIDSGTHARDGGDG